MSITSANLSEIAASLRGGAAPVTSVSDEVSTLSVVGGEDDESFVTAGQSIVDGSEPETEVSEDTSSDQATGPAEATAKSPVPAGKEFITVTDEKGKRKVEIDFNNKDQIKKYAQLAHGARKWQAERDQVAAKAKELEGQLSSLKSNWDVLESTYQKGGVEGLIDLLEGKPGAFREWEAARMERADFLKKASPAERELFEAKEREAVRQRELEEIRRQNEDFKKSVQAEREAAELKSLESTVHPVFDRYRFADKLGDSDTEQMFDEMLWNTALKRLEPYEEKGLLTSDLVEKEFKTVAVSLRKRINVQAEKRAAKAVEQKKQEATENVQAAVSSGYRSNDLSKEAMDLARQGNLTALFKGWSKFQKAFK